MSDPVAATAPRPGAVSLDVWAPAASRVRLLAGRCGDAATPDLDALHTVDMVLDEGGWWRLPASAGDLAVGGIDYAYMLDDDPHPYPDPRARFQPRGVHGLSRTFDPTTFPWTDAAWTGRQLAGSVIYELHVGTFTDEGTLDSAIGRLDHLVDLGIDIVELMPVASFNGEHGWGYDGVGWYAVHHAYGGPEAYLRFVDACHAKGLAVMQDVVHNHFGPSGAYAPRFGPYLDETSSSTWGASINLSGPDSDPVRRFIIDNALQWLRDYHVDGLRLDAVHALVDHRAVHVLEEMAEEVDALSAAVRRPLSLVAESDLNDPRLITSREAGGFGLTGQWSDDFHHALVANLTRDASGYYADFADLDALAKVVERGFFHDDTTSSFRGRRHGRRLDTLRVPASRLVVCSDNHDQIGNRADGARLSTRLTTRQLQAAATLTLLNASTPMVFMGEEWAASTPFAFFTSHPEPELGRLVSEGRLKEFERMDWDVSTVPDPQDPATFLGSKLRWDEVDVGEHAVVLQTYRELVRLRREYPDLVDPRFDWTVARHAAGGDAGSTRHQQDRPAGQWFLMERGHHMAVAVNFGVEPTSVTLDAASRIVHATGEAEVCGPDDTLLRLGPHSTAVVQHLGEAPQAAGDEAAHRTGGLPRRPGGSRRFTTPSAF